MAFADPSLKSPVNRDSRDKGDRPLPQRINKTIELLDHGQPVFCVGSHTGTELTYEAGKGLA